MDIVAFIIEAVLTTVFWDLLGQTPAMFLGAGTIFILRILAAHYRWKLPKA